MNGEPGQPAPRCLASSCQRAVPPRRGRTNPFTRTANRTGVHSAASPLQPPALLESEASVLPLDDPESKLDLRRPGGDRTLASAHLSRPSPTPLPATGGWIPPAHSHEVSYECPKQ